ncbi:MAG: ribbon-helix-helix protein, CopG family, partial [Gammaproteobacteria bacterium]
MTNLTITVDDEVLKRARLRALQEDTSVNALLRDALEAYAGVKAERESAVVELLRLAREAQAGGGAD